MKLPPLLLAFLLAFSASLGTVLPASADDPTTTVTWPEFTHFNPATTPYVVRVEDSAPGATYRAFESYSGREVGVLTEPGELELDFGDLSGTYRVIALQRCTPECETVAYSPPLHLHTKLWVRLVGGWHGPVALNEIEVNLDHDAVGPVTADWQLLPRGSSVPAASGTADVTMHADRPREGVFVFSAEHLERSTRYRLQVTVSADTEFGMLQGSDDTSIWWDAKPPGAELEMKYNALYPQRDGFRDSVYFTPRVDGGANGYGLVILDARGDQVKDLGGSAWKTWLGRNEEGERVSPGRYVVRLVARDASNNTTVVDRPLLVSNKVLVSRTFERTYSPAATMVQRYVGSCSRLAQPSSHGWKGSLGLYSQTTCARPADSIVATLHGVHVPRSATRYGKYRLSLFGGSAVGRSGAYARFGYLRQPQGRHFEVNRQISGSVTEHRGPERRGERFVFDQRNKPYVIWRVALAEGSWYDVKSFTISLDYTALVKPGRRRGADTGSAR